MMWTADGYDDDDAEICESFRHFPLKKLLLSVLLLLLL